MKFLFKTSGNIILRMRNENPTYCKIRTFYCSIFASLVVASNKCQPVSIYHIDLLYFPVWHLCIHLEV